MDRKWDIIGNNSYELVIKNISIIYIVILRRHLKLKRL